MPHTENNQSIRNMRNLARFFTEQRHIAWVSLGAVMLWGVYGLHNMPQRKDPDIPVRQAMIIVPWQGTTAEEVEQLVTKKVEQAIALNQWVTEIKSASRTGSAMIQFELAEKGGYDRDKELDDVKIRLDAIHDLPQGAGPILYIKDFGDTSALMLTVASPPADQAQVASVSKLVETRIREVRRGLTSASQPRYSVVVVYPKSMDSVEVDREMAWGATELVSQQVVSDVKLFSGAGFAGADFATSLSGAGVQASVRKLISDKLQPDEFHPDAWKPVIIGDPATTASALAGCSG